MSGLRAFSSGFPFTRNPEALARRAALLLGTSLAVYGVAAPSAALAQNECGAPPPGGGTVTCTPAGNPYPSGIDYDPVVQDLTVVLQPGVVVTNAGTPAHPNGVEIGSSTAGVDLSLQAGTQTQITTTAANHDAVDVVATDGTVTVAVDDIDTTQSGSRGIVASGRGRTTVTADTVATIGDNSDGISAEEGNFLLGGVPATIVGTSVTANSVSTLGDNSTGLIAFSENGDVVVDVGTVTTGGDFSTAILAISAVNDVRVTSDVVTTAGTNSIGIEAQIFPFPDETPVGTIVVDSGSVTTSGEGASGIVATAPTTDVTIVSDSVSTSGDNALGIVASIEGQAIAPGKYTYGEGDIVIESGSVATAGDRAPGIMATTVVGDISIESATASTQGDGSGGIVAESESGAIVIDSGTITTTGRTILGEPGVIAAGAHGIEATTVSGAITIASTSITTSGAEANGIVAESESGEIVIGSGTIRVTDGKGIEVRGGTGNVEVDSASVTTLGGLFSDGIIVETTSGDIDIASGTASVVKGVGLFALTDSGDITITSTSVTASGDLSAGISASGDYYTGGDIDVVSGSAATTGRFSDAITVTTPGVITIASTSITTAGEAARGIVADSSHGGITIDSGTIATTGVSGRAIKANVYYEAGVVIRSGTITTQGDNGDGITVATLADNSTGDFDITSTSITTRGNRANGIYAYHAGTGDIVVTSGSVTTSGNSEDVPYGGALGIDLQANSGSIRVTSTNVRTEGTGSIGIRSTTNAGAININSGTVTTLGAGATGIFAQTGPGSTVPEVPEDGDDINQIAPPARPPAVAPVAVPPDISITSGTVTTSGADARGIEALTIDGDIYIESGSVTTAGVRSGAIHALIDLNEEGPGSITIVSGTARTTGDSSTAIYAWSPSGDVNVTSTLAATTGNNSRGIFTASPNGNTVITSGTVTTRGTNVSEGIIGQSDVGNVTVTSQSIDILGSNRALVALSRGGGTVTVTSGAIATHGTDAPGINATSATGNVNVTSTTITTDRDFSPGLQAQAGFEQQTGSVVINSGSVTTGGASSRAIFASAAVNATVTSANVTTTGNESVGILAFVTSGNLSITSGNVTTSGTNADAIIANRGTIDIRSTGTVATSGADADGIAATTQTGPVTIDANAINVTGAGSNAIVTTSAASSTLTIRGLVRSTSGFAVQADGGPATIGIVAGGTIRGRVDLTEGVDRINNAGTFDAIGTSLFGGGADVFTNTGITRSVNGAAVLTSVDTFNSSGRIEMNDGAANDRLTIGGTFNGLTGSRVALDVDFAARTADVLVTGLATGTTGIEAIGIGQNQGGFTSGGILLVDAAAGTQANAFTLVGGATTVSNAFITSGLIFDAANFDFLLGNTPNQPVFETAAFGETNSELWYRGADAVSAQLEAARDGSGGEQGAGTSQLMGGGRLGAWAQVVGARREREASQTFGTSVFDISYEQDFRGLQAGLDHQTEGLIFGVTFGLGRSDVEFETSPSTLELETLNAGAYAQVQAGSFFANALVKVDWIDAETNPGAGLETNFDATAIGARLTAGFRFDLGSLWAEPAASLSWVSTDIDDFVSGGATIAFDEATSLRGSLGVRVGGDFAAGAGTLSPSLGIHAIEELNGSNRNDFTFGSTLALEQDAPGTFGRATAGLTYSTGSLEAFIRGEMDFGGETEGRGGRVGLRLRF